MRRRSHAWCAPISSRWAPISASTEPPAALVVGTLAAPVDRSLAEALGAERADAVRAWLEDNALAWASEHGPAVHAVVADGSAAVGKLLGHTGPVLLVAPDVPALTDRLARAALADLADGADVAVAPATDGRPFLIALATPDPELVHEAAGSVRDRRDAAALTGGELGLLRSERRLVTAGDARAFAADPLTPPGLAALLG